MTEDYSKQGLIKFLDFQASKGLMNPATAASRKAAVNSFLGILSDAELTDLRKLDFDDVAKRFLNLKGDQFKPESVKVYKGRVTNAFEDLKRYRNDPLSFKPNMPAARGAPAMRTEKEGGKEVSKAKLGVGETLDQAVTFPVPIRPDVIVRITGIPNDLTSKEATKIANVIRALATEPDADN